MREIVTAAHRARETLAAALGALQGPGVPEAMLEVAEPVAKAMSALHRIEASQGADSSGAALLALDSVRRALGQLQTTDSPSAIVDQVVALVAEALGAIHQINQAMPSAPEPGPAVQLQRREVAVRRPAPAAQRQEAAARQPRAEARHREPPRRDVPIPQHLVARPKQPTTNQAQPDSAASSTRIRPAVLQGASQEHSTSAESRVAPGRAAVAAVPPSVTPTSAAAAREPIGTPKSAQHPLRRIDAELGANSSTNFYKGLAGNDVIDSGGIFVATYLAPKLGEELSLHVSLPGGYEFEATAVVEWTRTISDASSYAPPGFGARFKRIPHEGRQLVYRYVRNREPLLHDDL